MTVAPWCKVLLCFVKLQNPLVLLELVYIDGPESKKISDSAYQDKLVAGIVSGIQNFYKTAK